jgi:hypothetical protein
MIEGVARLVSRQTVRVERATAIFRLAYVSMLLALFMLLGERGGGFTLAHLLAVLAACLAAAYSVLLLVLIRRGACHERMGHVSAAVDVVAATIYFGLFLGLPAGPRRELLVLAAEAYFFVPLFASVVKLKGSHGLSTTILGVLGAAGAVTVFWLFDGRAVALGHQVFLPGLLLLAGLAAWFSVRAYLRMLGENFVTEELLRSSRRLRMALEIVQISIMNLSQFVGNLERVSSTLAVGAHNQAKSIDRIATSAENLKGAMGDISGSTQTSAASIQRTLDFSTQGNQTMQRMVGEIADIHQVGSRMDAALQLINEIADQTNLLALNAAIEASRTGDEASGFSVVAGEMRTLAERSAETSSDIGKLVRQMEKVIFAGDESAREAGATFDRINKDLEEYAGFVRTLDLAVREQLSANQLVSDSLEKIRSVTGENSRAADEVREVIGELKKEVAKLKALVDGKLLETPALGGAQSAPPKR